MGLLGFLLTNLFKESDLSSMIAKNQIWGQDPYRVGINPETEPLKEAVYNLTTPEKPGYWHLENPKQGIKYQENIIGKDPNTNQLIRALVDLDRLMSLNPWWKNRR